MADWRSSPGDCSRADSCSVEGGFPTCAKSTMQQLTFSNGGGRVSR